MIYDFIKVLHSARYIYTKNHYFSMDILFTIIFLLHKQRLNPRNHSNQELIMEIFLWATGDDMNMYVKIQSITKGRYL
jgi:hypothetical protein